MPASSPHPFVANRRDVDAAADLVTRFGASAPAEAASRAARARDIGNHVNFCRWRQVERLVGWLAMDAVVGTVH